MTSIDRAPINLILYAKLDPVLYTLTKEDHGLSLTAQTQSNAREHLKHNMQQLHLSEPEPSNTATSQEVVSG